MKDKRDAYSNNEMQYLENKWWSVRPCWINFTGMTVLWLKHRLSPQALGFEQLVVSWWCYFGRLKHLWKVEPWWKKVYHWGQALVAYSLTGLPVLFLCLNANNVWSVHFLALPGPIIIFSLPVATAFPQIVFYSSQL